MDEFDIVWQAAHFEIEKSKFDSNGLVDFREPNVIVGEICHEYLEFFEFFESLCDFLDEFDRNQRRQNQLLVIEYFAENHEAVDWVEDADDCLDRLECF